VEEKLKIGKWKTAGLCGVGNRIAGKSHVAYD
jgi:hypothetical protein